MAERSRVSIRLSDEAHRGLDTACQGAGITLTALIEAIGLTAAREPSALTDRGPDIIELARAIDLERRNRR